MWSIIQWHLPKVSKTEMLKSKLQVYVSRRNEIIFNEMAFIEVIKIRLYV